MNKPKMILFDYGQTLISEERFDGIAGTTAVLAEKTALEELKEVCKVRGIKIIIDDENRTRINYRAAVRALFLGECISDHCIRLASNKINSFKIV